MIYAKNRRRCDTSARKAKREFQKRNRSGETGRFRLHRDRPDRCLPIRFAFSLASDLSHADPRRAARVEEKSANPMTELANEIRERFFGVRCLGVARITNATHDSPLDNDNIWLVAFDLDCYWTWARPVLTPGKWSQYCENKMTNPNRNDAFLSPLLPWRRSWKRTSASHIDSAISSEKRKNLAFCWTREHDLQGMDDELCRITGSRKAERQLGPKKTPPSIEEHSKRPIFSPSTESGQRPKPPFDWVISTSLFPASRREYCGSGTLVVASITPPD